MSKRKTGLKWPVAFGVHAVGNGAVAMLVWPHFAAWVSIVASGVALVMVGVSIRRETSN